MRATFLFFLLINFPGVHASSETCANLLASGGYKKVLRQAFDLGVLEADEAPPLQNLYLKLKDAEWAPLEIDKVRGRIESKARHYRVSQMDDREAIQFYRNSLRGLYIRVAEMWRLQEVRTQVGPVMKSELEDILGMLLARSFSPWSLEDAELSPQAAREHFESRRWMMWPWMNIAGFTAGFLESDKSFSDYWDQAGAPLPFEYYHKLNRALAEQKLKTCCLSEPGCRNCPHNRAWLSH